jgi:hypothetical protein
MDRAEIVQLAQVNVGADGARLDRLQQSLGLRFDNRFLTYKSSARSLAARTQRSLVEPCLVSTSALRASCQVRVETPESCRQVGLGDLQVKVGWRRAWFLASKHCSGAVAVLGFETESLTRFAVDAVKSAPRSVR